MVCTCSHVEQDYYSQISSSNQTQTLEVVTGMQKDKILGLDGCGDWKWKRPALEILGDLGAWPF